MRFVLLAALVAFVCYVSILDPVADAQDVTTKAPAPPKNKTCKGLGKGGGKKRPARAAATLGGSGRVSVTSGGASASATAGGGVTNPATAMANAVSKAGKDAAAFAIAGSRKVQAAVKDGVNTAKKAMTLPKRQGSGSGANSAPSVSAGGSVQVQG